MLSGELASAGEQQVLLVLHTVLPIESGGHERLSSFCTLAAPTSKAAGFLLSPGISVALTCTPDRCLEAVPLPSQDSHQNALWANMRPCLAVAPLHPSGPAQEGQGEQEYASAHKPQWQVQLYSLRNHTYFHAIEVASRVLGLRCSCRILAVALDSQVGSTVMPALILFVRRGALPVAAHVTSFVCPFASDKHMLSTSALFITLHPSAACIMLQHSNHTYLY